MAEKILKTRKQFTSTLRTDLLEKIQNLSKETDVPLSKLLDRAVESYLKKEESSEK